MSVKRYDYGYQDGYSADGMTGLQFADDGALVKYEDYAELEARYMKLAAESAGLKLHLQGTAEYCYSELPETPATDAFLAEVRAQGVEMFADSLKVVGGHEHPYSVVANEFAAQLRQEAAK